MKLNKIFLSLLAGAALLGAGACNEEVKYDPAAPSALTPYYISTTNSVSRDLLDGQKNFTVTMGRIDTKGELTVPLHSEVTPDNPFTIPTEVTFADGVGVIEVPVQFDLSDLIVNQEYVVSLWFDGIENTPYSYGRIDITVKYLPWTKLGTGIYREDCITTFFNIDNDQWEVEIEEHPTTKGMYRVVNPYNENCPFIDMDMVDTSEDHYMVINAVNPDAVYIQNFWSGLTVNPEYGEVVITSEAYLNMLDGQTLQEQIDNNLVGTLKDGIVKMPERSLLIGMTLYNDFGLYYANKNGMFKVVLPGYEDEKGWEEVGMCQFTDGLAGPFEGQTDNTYSVLVEKDLQNEGMYRIVNPFGVNSGYVDANPEEPEYLVIDATDPECVLIGQTEAPFSQPIRGKLVVTTYADVEYSKGELSKTDLAGEGIGGKLVDGVLTIPGDQVRGRYGKTGAWKAPSKPVNVVLDMKNAVPTEPEGEATAATKKAGLKKAVVKKSGEKTSKSIR